MPEHDKTQIDKEQLTREALAAADRLCTAVLRGDPGQQRLALAFARTLDDARRIGLELTKDC